MPGAFLRTKYYVDLSGSQYGEEQFDALLRKFHAEPRLKKPPLGNNPYRKETQDSQVEPPNVEAISQNRYHHERGYGVK